MKKVLGWLSEDDITLCELAGYSYGVFGLGLRTDMVAIKPPLMDGAVKSHCSLLGKPFMFSKRDKLLNPFNYIIRWALNGSQLGACILLHPFIPDFKPFVTETWATYVTIKPHREQGKMVCLLLLWRDDFITSGYVFFKSQNTWYINSTPEFGYFISFSSTLSKFPLGKSASEFKDTVFHIIDFTILKVEQNLWPG